jgi:nucleotide-binding universal stress UspA family protein
MKRFKSILFVADPEKACKIPLERTVQLAENNQAELTVVNLVPRISPSKRIFDGDASPADLQAALVSSHLQRLDSLIAPYARRLSIRVKVLVGTPYLEITRAVLRNRHDLVVRPPENPAWLDRLFGSDDMNLLRKCPCPVWLIKCKGPRSFRRILAAVDVDDSYPPEEREIRHAMNCQVLEMAGALALSEFAELHVVHVWDAIGEMVLRGTFVSTPKDEVAAYVKVTRERNAANLAALLREVTGILGTDALEYLRPKTHLVKGLARKEITVLARQLKADLVVMGTVGRTGIPGLIMGNTAETILQQVDCSVLAIKPPGFVTPVSLEG